MKNWLSLVTLTLIRTSRMTRLQQIILIGSIILPGGSLILIFSRFGRRIIRKLTKVRTSKTFGKLINEQELIEQLPGYEDAIAELKKKVAEKPSEGEEAFSYGETSE